MRHSTTALSFAALLSACGAPHGSATVSGQLEPGSFSLDNPVIVATDEAGATYEAYVDPHLSFSLPLPSGRLYSFALANSTRSGSLAVISNVNVATGDGLARYVLLDDVGVLDVGLVRSIDWATFTDGNPPVTQHQKKSSGNDGSDDGEGGKSPNAPTCTGSSVVESATTHILLKLHGAGGSGASAPFVADGGVGGGNGAGETKVTICHIPPGNPANEHTITVGAPAVPAHLAHGDYVGACTNSTTPPPSACPPSDGNDGPSADGGSSPADGGVTTGGGPTGGTPTDAPDMAQSPNVPPYTPSCQVNADCATGNACFSGVCNPVIP